MKALAISVAVAAFLGLIVWAMGQQRQAECEVCVTYQGQTDCRKARAGSEREAFEAAQRTACGILTGSMTRDLECMRQTPSRVSCTP